MDYPITTLTDPVRTDLKAGDVLENSDVENLYFILTPEDSYEEDFEEGRNFVWKDSDGSPLSSPFFLPAKPRGVIAFDPDQDGDGDMAIEMEDGSVWFSYNLQGNVILLTAASTVEELTPDVIAYMTGNGRIEKKCFGDPQTMFDYFRLLHLPYMAMRDLRRFWKETQALGDAEEMIEEANAINNPLADLSNRFFTKEMIDRLAENRRKETADPCTLAQDQILSAVAEALKEFMRIIRAGERELPFLEKLDGGIGVALLDPGTIPLGYVEVAEVAPDSPAEKAGIEAGDHIEEVNGVKVDWLEGNKSIQEKGEFLRAPLKTLKFSIVAMKEVERCGEMW